MACACGGSSSDATAEYEVRLPNGDLKIVSGIVAAEMLVRESGGGQIVKKRV